MEVIRVATHNTCHTGWNPRNHSELFPDLSQRKGYFEENLEEMRKNWETVYSGFFADLIGLQEYCGWFDLSHTKRTDDVVFKPLGFEVMDGNEGIAVATRFPLTPVYEKDFLPTSVRRRQKFYVEIGGKRIAVFNCHPSPKLDQGELRQAEYRMLLRDFREEEWFIAVGDYNARTAAEYELFREAGFPMANNGIPTVRKTGSACDNIIVSPNIRIENVRCYDEDFLLSDHVLFAADLILP